MSTLSQDELKQYEAATEGIGLIDLSARSRVELRGPDRATFLQNFCTNDVARLKTGECCEAFITTGQGKIIAHVVAFCLEESLLLDADPGLADKIIAHLDRYLITEQVELIDRTDDLTHFRLCGRAPMSDPGSTGILPVFTNNTITAPGHDVFVPKDQAADFMRKLLDLGANAIGPEVCEILRVETGWPTYGRDINETNLPQEINRNEKAISFTKGCYLGQETVARIHALGHVNRLLVQLHLSGNEPVPQGAVVQHAGKDVGLVSSSVFSPRANSAIALAMIRREHAAEGKDLEVVAGTGSVSARVTK